MLLLIIGGIWWGWRWLVACGGYVREGVVVRAGLFLEKARIAFSLVGGDFVDGGGDFAVLAVILG